LELEVFAGQEKSELSMIEVARAILEQRGRDHEMHFSDLVNEIQNYLGTSNSDIREALPLFYTELNFDGSFISLGDNKWGLRSWYGVALSYDDENPDDEKNEVEAYDAEINEIAPDDLGEDVELVEEDDEDSEEEEE